MNHVNVCISYPALLNTLNVLSQKYDAPIKQWISDGESFKFVGDNLDKKIGVRDVRVDNQPQMLHMYSLVAVKSRINHTALSTCTDAADTRPLTSFDPDHFLPLLSEVNSVKQNLVVIVSRILVKYIKALNPLSKAIPEHIDHQYSAEQSMKSEVAVVDVLMKNETSSIDMLDIMKKMQSYTVNLKDRVLSGGDLTTCERQVAAQHHVMDGNTREEQLMKLEPVVEDFHLIMNLLDVSASACWMHNYFYILYCS